jgi:hypothetical protein
MKTLVVIRMRPGVKKRACHVRKLSARSVTALTLQLRWSSYLTCRGTTYDAAFIWLYRRRRVLICLTGLSASWSKTKCECPAH